MSVLKETKVAFLPDLRNRFTYLLRQQGEENDIYRTEKVKRYLHKHFGERITVFQPESRSHPCVMYAADLTPMQIAQLLEDARKGRKSGTPSSDEDEVFFPVDASH